MDDAVLATFLTVGGRQGIAAVAMADYLRRASEAFPLGTTPRPEDLASWTEGLRATAPHLFAQAPPASVVPDVYAAISSPTERLTAWRAAHPVETPRPQLSPTELAEVSAMASPTARLTRARELLAQKGPA